MEGSYQMLVWSTNYVNDKQINMKQNIINLFFPFQYIFIYLFVYFWPDYKCGLKCVCVCVCVCAVSYTHLDVYKRQVQDSTRNMFLIRKKKVYLEVNLFINIKCIIYIKKRTVAESDWIYIYIYIYICLLYTSRCV